MSQLQWQKSSFSDSGGENCVELAAAVNGTVLLRESEAPGVVLSTTPARFAAFLDVLKAGGSAPAAP
ncbi:DUF397 domain-containing protein [Streptomyces sp. SID13588]|uniref:DUF397 domain-containing protein n=1 Tax=Streptomyces sp. SID13588 TaxID=2706051 RepID=UPI0013CAB25E|nr:DUF397 domain-containing protein [Streptomyces sp. SID13588]NEA73257.1 DUF397 domain-containing protein [Streptomyces sp. SID13588]